jgi:hypothetical protein
MSYRIENSFPRQLDLCFKGKALVAQVFNLCTSAHKDPNRLTELP